MKVLKTIGILLLSLFAIAMILMLIVPAKQHIKRTITINAPVSVVYKHLSNPATFYNWMVWCLKDTTITTATSGEASDVPGATIFWVGNPATSGKGMIEFVSMKVNREIEHKVTFLEPEKADAKSAFKLLEVNGQTKLTWEFDLATPRPKNILNLLSSLDKKLGDEFEEGLKNLKAIIEKNDVASAVNENNYVVQPMNFPATSFAVYRQEKVNHADIPSFYATHLPRIYEEVMTVKATPGFPSGLFYIWDEVNQQADIAAAIAVPAGTQIDNNDIQIIDISASKAVYVDYYGDYSQTVSAYKSIDKYLLANSLKQKAPVIEQYITDPAIEKDRTKWLTKIIFLVE